MMQYGRYRLNFGIDLLNKCHCCGEDAEEINIDGKKYYICESCELSWEK